VGGGGGGGARSPRQERRPPRAPLPARRRVQGSLPPPARPARRPRSTLARRPACCFGTDHACAFAGGCESSGSYSPATSLRRRSLPTGDLGIVLTNTQRRGALYLAR